MSPPLSKAGASFTQIYDTLPPEAQRTFLRGYLVPLLDDLPDSVSTKVINAAKEMQTLFTGIPKLDYNALRTELEQLLNDIERDRKQAQYIKERSTREKLFEETIDSLSTWVNDIWSVIFEYQTNFHLAHQCLLLAAEILSRMFAPHGRCNCIFVNLRFVTNIRRRKTGKVVKTFRLVGVAHFERVLLWTWRDLFVSMLASNPGQKQLVPDMLQDIRAILGWKSLPRMLFGGRMNTIDGVFEDESDEELDSDVDDDDDEDEFLTEDEDNESQSWQDYPSSFHFHANHWPKSTSFAINDIRDLVQQSLVSYFETAPSPEMYRAIRCISTDATTIRRSLLEAAESNALWSSDNFAAALSIFASEDSTETIWKLLSRGTHLLRPCDAPEYQNAVVSLSTKSAFKSRALTMCQDQLLSIAREFRASLCLSFSRLYDSARVVELEALLKQRSVSRTSNIESWVSAVSTPGPSHPHPMAFAAMMMGLPVPVPVAGGELGGVDEINMLDLEKDTDPDLDDLREEFRPQFQERIQGWLGATLAIGKQDKVFRAVFEELLTMMPFLRDSDIIEEMVNRISDIPSKQHICDGLTALHGFVTSEVCKERAKQERRKRKEEKAKRSARGKQAPNSTSRTSRTPAAPTNLGPSSRPLSGFDDVD
ncbi:hypothetical protein F5888DRAFT_434913 [Russula emetica]|nr:hypothetical protein F5888DRAFT_434913 [Russula emetica]